VARSLPTLVVFALLGSTAAAFAITEGLKLEKSPIARTAVDKVIAPGSNTSSRASIGFFLRKPDRLTVVIVDRHGNVVRTLARSRPAPRGTQQFTWDGRDDEHLLVPDGTYRPRVHLAHEHRTILLPNPIRMDATPPLIKLVSVAPRVFSPDGDGRRDFPRIQYRTSEKARALIYVDGDRRATVRHYVRAGKFDWRGRAVRRLPAGAYRVTLRAIDLAGNVGRPSRSVTVFVRYLELRPHVLRVKTDTRFGVRVLTDAKRYSVHLKGLHVLRSGRILVLHAPTAPGRYVLRVAANGHVARAIVLVSR
jgi:FlgD Ig-like domain